MKTYFHLLRVQENPITRLPQLSPVCAPYPGNPGYFTADISRSHAYRLRKTIGGGYVVAKGRINWRESLRTMDRGYVSPSALLQRAGIKGASV